MLSLQVLVKRAFQIMPFAIRTFPCLASSHHFCHPLHHSGIRIPDGPQRLAAAHSVKLINTVNIEGRFAFRTGNVLWPHIKVNFIALTLPEGHKAVLMRALNSPICKYHVILHLLISSPVPLNPVMVSVLPGLERFRKILLVRGVQVFES